MQSHLFLECLPGIIVVGYSTGHICCIVGRYAGHLRFCNRYLCFSMLSDLRVRVSWYGVSRFLKYAGLPIVIALNVSIMTLNFTLLATVSQCRFARIGAMWQYLLAPVTKRADIFCTSCNFFLNACLVNCSE